MNSVKQKGLFACMAVLCASAVIAGIMLIAPVTVHAAEGDGYVVESEAGEVTEGAVAMAGNVAYPDLQSAVNAANDGDTIELVADVKVLNANVQDSRVGVIIGKSLTINGNNHKIYTENTAIRRLVWVENKNADIINVELNDTNIVNNVPAGRALETRSGNIGLTLNNCVLDCSESKLIDNSNRCQTFVVGGSGDNIVVNIVDSSIMASGSGYAISVFNPADINIVNSYVNCPKGATAEYDGVVGFTAIFLYGANSSLGSSGTNLVIDSSVVMARNDNSGYSNDFSVITCQDENPDAATTIKVTGDSLIYAIKDAGNANMSVFGSQPFATDINIEVESGTFLTNSLTEYLSLVSNNLSNNFDEENVSIVVNGGAKFNNPFDTKYLKEGLMLYPSENGFATGSEEEAVAAGAKAAIGKVAYASLIEAVAAVQDGETITLLADDLDANGIIVPSGSNFTIDFSGHTYVVTKNLAGSPGTQSQVFQLLKGSTIVLKNGTLRGGVTSVGVIIQNYADLTLENMTLDAAGSPNASCEALGVNNGNVIIKGNTKLLARDTYYAFDVYYWPSNGYTDGATVTFAETFNGEVTGKILYSDDGSDAANADKKLAVTINGNGSFDVTISAPETANITANSGNFASVLPIEYIGENSALYTDNSGAYTVATSAPADMEKVSVLVGDKAYSSIEAALEATEGEVQITLYDDVFEDVVIPEGREVTLNLNGKTITNVSGHTITNYGTLTIEGEGVVTNMNTGRAALYNAQGGTAVIKGGTFTRDEGTWYVIANDGAMTINDAVAENGNAADPSSLIINNWSYGKNAVPATLEIENGTFTCAGGNVVKNDEGGGLVTIKNGVFTTSAGGNSTVQNWSDIIIDGGRFVNDGINGTALHVAVYGGQTNNTEINGGEFVANRAVLLDNGYGAGYGTGSIDFAVTDGTFEGAVTEKLNFGLLETDVAAVSGGKFSQPVSEDMLVDGYTLSYDTENGTFTPAQGTTFAHVVRGGKTYTFAQPYQAIAFAEEGETVVFDVSFRIGGSVIINKSINLDLNGQTIIGTATGKATLQINGLEEGKAFNVNVFSSKEGAKIASQNSLALWVLHDANVTATGITLESNLRAVDVGMSGDLRNSSLTLTDCVINTNGQYTDGVGVWGNITEGNEQYYDTLNPTTLILNNTAINAHGYAVFGNGMYHNTYIEINDSNLTTDGSGCTGIYHPQNGTIIVNGGSITAENAAIEIRAGKLTVTGDAVLTATSAEFATQPNGSGNTIAGAAIGVSQHTTNFDIEVNIESGTFNGVKAVYEEDLQDTESSNIAINITGGQFNGAVESENVTGFITGGQFKELPEEETFAQGLAGEAYDGYYVVVDAADKDAVASVSDRRAAQNELRAYLAAFGLTIGELRLSEDELAVAAVNAYDGIAQATTKTEVANALSAAMDAVDAYIEALNNSEAEAEELLSQAKAEALEELNSYADGNGELAKVALPTYIISAINGAETVEQVETYVLAAKTEMDEIRAERAKAEAQYEALKADADALMKALGVSGTAEDGYTSEVLDNINGIIAALGITETDGAWSSTLLKDVNDAIAAANENIAEMQALLGTAADDATAQTVIGMIKDTQASIAEAETNITNLINGLKDEINAKFETLQSAVDTLPDSETVGALADKISALETSVGTMNTTVSDFGTTVDNRLEKVETTIESLTSAQEKLETAVEGYKTAVDATLADIQGKFDELSVKVDALPTDEELATALAKALLDVTAKIEAIKAETDKIDSLDDTIIAEVSADIAEAFAAFKAEFNTAIGDVNGQLGALEQAIEALPDNTEAIAELKSMLTAAQQEIDNANGKLGELDTAIGNLDGKVDGLDGAIATVDGVVDGIASAQQQMSETLNELASSFDEAINNSETGIKAQLGALEQAIEALPDNTEAIAELKSMLTAAQEAIDTADGKLDNLDTAVGNLGGKVDGLDSAIATVDGVVDGIASAQQELKSLVEGYKTAVENKLSEIQGKLDGLETSIAALPDNTEAIAELKSMLTAAQQEIDNVVEKLNSLGAADGENATDLAALAQKITELQSSVDGVAASVDNVVADGENSASNFVGIYLYMSVLVVLVVVILIVVSVKKRK